MTFEIRKIHNSGIAIPCIMKNNNIAAAWKKKYSDLAMVRSYGRIRMRPVCNHTASALRHIGNDIQYLNMTFIHTIFTAENWHIILLIIRNLQKRMRGFHYELHFSSVVYIWSRVSISCHIQ
jgi:hypothetical protein